MQNVDLLTNDTPTYVRCCASSDIALQYLTTHRTAFMIETREFLGLILLSNLVDTTAMSYLDDVVMLP